MTVASLSVRLLPHFDHHGEPWQEGESGERVIASRNIVSTGLPSQTTETALSAWEHWAVLSAKDGRQQSVR